MKVRNGFVSNSSSSSFVIINAGETTLYVDGDISLEHCGGFSINIDEFIVKLQAAKATGATHVNIEHGGGYDG